jgi:Leucine-rich repeat (LRR) protein
MKKIYFLLLALCLFTGAKAQIVNIPDAKFKAKLLAAGPNNQIAKDLTGNWTKIDADNNGNIEVSEALQLSYLDASQNISPSPEAISSLQGIESFGNLQFLNCSLNSLASLNVSALTNLQNFGCDFNQLTTLNISGLTNLKVFYCNKNHLTSLNVSGFTNLQILHCDDNLLPSLNVNGLTNLIDLNCNYNRLASLDVSGLINLQTLDCNGNLLTSLDVSGLANLQNLRCGSNQVLSLNLNGLSSLLILGCDRNLLTSLDVSGLTNLIHLGCTNNLLTSLDVSGLINLQTLYCNNNQLTTLDVSNSVNLEYLFCHTNQLTSLYIKNGKIEAPLQIYNNPNLQYICADDAQIAQIQGWMTQSGSNCVVNSSCNLDTAHFESPDYFTLYPNPATSVLNLAVENGVEVNSIAVYNTLGQLVLAISNAQRVSVIDVSGLTSGNYFIKMNTDKGASNRMFVKD